MDGFSTYVYQEFSLRLASSFAKPVCMHTKLIVRGVVEMSGNRMESTLQVAEVGH